MLTLWYLIDAGDTHARTHTHRTQWDSRQCYGIHAIEPGSLMDKSKCLIVILNTKYKFTHFHVIILTSRFFYNYVLYQVIKLYGWEPMFIKKISEVREKELRLLFKYAVLDAVESFAWLAAIFWVIYNAYWAVCLSAVCVCLCLYIFPVSLSLA